MSVDDFPVVVYIHSKEDMHESPKLRDAYQTLQTEKEKKKEKNVDKLTRILLPLLPITYQPYRVPLRLYMQTGQPGGGIPGL